MKQTTENDNSSRSHSFLKVKFKLQDGNEKELIFGDLAGQESTQDDSVDDWINKHNSSLMSWISDPSKTTLAKANSLLKFLSWGFKSNE